MLNTKYVTRFNGESFLKVTDRGVITKQIVHGLLCVYRIRDLETDEVIDSWDGYEKNLPARFK